MDALIWPSSVLLAVGLMPFVLEKGRVSPVGLLLPNLALVAIGYVVLDVIANTSTWPYYFVCMISVLIGYYLGQHVLVYGLRIGSVRILAGRDSHASMLPITESRRRQILLLFSVVLFFIAYHFAVGGIPILKPDLEVARFDFSSSGLFGIPGRMASYGWRFVVILASVYYWRTGDRSWRTPFVAVWIIFFVIALMSGFKSSLLQVLMTLLLLRALTGNPVRLRQMLSLKFLALALLVLAYAVLISYKYSSIGANSLASVGNYIGLRLCVLPAQPGHHGITNLESARHSGVHFAEDMRYFSRKYAKVDLDEGQSFPLDQQISSAIYGTHLSDDSWIVPVTVGGFAEFTINFGRGLGIVATLLTGMLLSYFVARCRSSQDAPSAACWGLGTQMIIIFLLNGGLVHALVNTSAVVLMLLSILWGLKHLIHQSPSQRSGETGSQQP